MESLLPVLEARGANSVRVTSLLEKRTELSSGFRGHYVGFSIPDKFVVGYCLDFNEFFRCGRAAGMDLSFLVFFGPGSSRSETW